MATPDGRRERKEFRVRDVPTKTHREIESIAAHYGISVTDFLRLRIKEIADSFPDHIKNRVEKGLDSM